MKTTVTAANIDAQGPGIADRSKGLRPRINAREGVTWHITAHGYASRNARWGMTKDPDSKSPTSVSDMTPRPHR
jgi:hypothetical protein